MRLEFYEIHSITENAKEYVGSFRDPDAAADIVVMLARHAPDWQHYEVQKVVIDTWRGES